MKFPHIKSSILVISVTHVVYQNSITHSLIEWQKQVSQVSFYGCKIREIDHGRLNLIGSISLQVPFWPLHHDVYWVGAAILEVTSCLWDGARDARWRHIRCNIIVVLNGDSEETLFTLQVYPTCEDCGLYLCFSWPHYWCAPHWYCQLPLAHAHAHTTVGGTYVLHNYNVFRRYNK